MNENFLTAQETLKYLNVTYVTLFAYRTRGYIKVYHGIKYNRKKNSI